MKIKWTYDYYTIFFREENPLNEMKSIEETHDK